jgi:hypothetical protein
VKSIYSGRADGSARSLAGSHCQAPASAPSVGAGFPTNENLDAQRAWVAHIEAGRIKVIR